MTDELHGITYDEARSLIRLLTPLSGRALDGRTFGFKSRTIQVDAILDALRLIADGVDSLEADAERTAGDDGRQRDEARWLRDRNTDREFGRVLDRLVVSDLLDLSGLTSRERYVIDLLYGLTSGAPMEPVEVAAACGMSREWVHMTRRHALDKIRAEALHTPELRAAA